jgi:predicted PurR-regulated permease PerM
MNAVWRVLSWLMLLAVGLALLWLLQPVLLPFVAGAAIAYVFDPVVRQLERWGMRRVLATSVVVCLFFFALAGAFAVLAPILQRQLAGLIQRLIELAQDMMVLARPYLEEAAGQAGMPQIKELGGASDVAGKVIGWAGGFLAGIWSGGLALVNLISLVVITPIVAWYLLRDWPRMVAYVDALLPVDHAETIRAQFRLIDQRLAGFLRGQALVCLLLGIFYAVSLTLAGLNYSLIVGLLSGVLTFIPFVGATVGLVVSLAVALFQFDDWTRIAIVAGVFMFGQFLEGNFFTPKLVGDRVGLHPVWLIFALLAGGALFGFFGMLLAVPVAASAGVLLRFALDRYLDSPLYRGVHRPGTVPRRID